MSIRAFAWIRLGFYWLRSRYAPQNAFVRCRTCPHWLVHSTVDTRLPAAKLPLGLTQPLTLTYIAGLCLKDSPRIFNDFTTGYALRIWTGDDWCHRHPLYDAHSVQGSTLQYRPGVESYKGAAGFSRLPTFAEAVQLATKGNVQFRGEFGREHKRAEFKMVADMSQPVTDMSDNAQDKVTVKQKE